jgi:hypothetical protein
MLKSLVVAQVHNTHNYKWTKYEQRSKQKLRKINKGFRKFAETLDQIAKDDVQHTKELFQEKKQAAHHPVDEPFDVSFDEQ